MRSRGAIGRRRGRGAVVSLLVLFLGGLCGCNNNDEGDTINVNGLDCGLIRDHVFGAWTATYASALRTLSNCDDATYDGTQVDVANGTTVYQSQAVFVGDSSVGFTIWGTGPVRDKELIASVDADSCLTLAQTWEDDDSGYLQCFGTADLAGHLLNVICDQFDLDTDGDGAGDTACSLNGSVTGTVGLP